MKLLYIGGGYVGSCSAAVSADSGHDVLVYDINSELIKKLSSGDKDTIESVLFEENLGELIIRNKERLEFTDQLSKVREKINEIEAVFMCLPTPEKDSTGETDLSYYLKAAEDLANVLAKRNNGEQTRHVLIVNKSTVPIQMVEMTKNILDSHGVRNYGLGSNPEFLIEGKAIEGSIRPQRVVVGAKEEKDFKIFRDIYKRFYDSPSVDYIEVNPAEAEAGKLLANYLLFKRLTNCFDVVGRTCEKFDNINFENVRKIIITDKRIGDWGFYNSLFAGGSCFIKDARSLAYQLQKKGARIDLVNSALGANKRQLINFITRAELEANFRWPGKKVGILGLSFKRHTNDIRNSAAVFIAENLLDKDVYEIKAYDPVAGKNFLKHFNEKQNKIFLANNEKEVIKDVDVLMITTDWPQFRELAPVIINNLKKGALIMDGRRMLHHKYGELSRAGYDVIAVGSPMIKKMKIEELKIKNCE
ncbi:MAG: nucleotide sugar dehydrogenase [Patescibacteria group bacterium]